VEDFVARNSRWRLALLIALGAGFVVTGFWMTGGFGAPPRPAIAWFGWVAIVFFGACSLALAVRFFDRSDQVRISSAGVYSRQWSEDTIPWSEIRDVSIWQFQRERTIVLHLRDPQMFPSRKLLGRLAGANRALTGGDVSISLTGTDRSFDDALAAIGRHASIRS
jgi:hypothetical protein